MKTIIPKVKKPKLINNALFKNALNDYITNSTDEVISKNIHDLRHFTNHWLGFPTKDRIDEMKKMLPFLGKLLNYEVVSKRLSKINSYDYEPFGIHISAIIPELETIINELISKYKDLPQGIRKAELWLKPIAEDALSSSDLEAAIYFASRGRKDLIDINKIKDGWHSAICNSIIRGQPVGKISNTVLERAKNKVISLSEAAEVLKFNETLPTFFSYRDEERDFIDATFFRSIEWFDITGFEPWINSFAHEASLSTSYGLDQIPTSWWLFFQCRSDLWLKRVEKISIETMLWTLMNGPLEKNKPWRQFFPNRHDRQYYNTDYIPIAGILPFVWHKINPQNLKYTIIDDALELLFSAQLKCGAWSLETKDNKPDIIATCFAIHGIALAKPKGWKLVCKKAADWLLSVQGEGGYWHIDGGPTIMLTVLVLDSINLSNESDQLTFNFHTRESRDLNRTNKKYAYDFSKENYYNPIPPKILSKSFKDLVTLIKPKVAIVVATSVELEQTLQLLIPLKRRNKILKTVHKNFTYYLGRIGAFNSVIILSNMGSDGPTGSLLAVENLIIDWDPQVIFLVGIAFGADYNKHKPGDVLVAEYIIPYEQQRVGKKIVFRNPIPPTSHLLINRFKNTIDWKFQRPDKTLCEIHYGPILSGSKLVDNPKFKQDLLNQYPNAMGGEMEGAGLWSSASSHGKDWIIVKSVCDWGDGNKDKEFQKLAAASSMSLCNHVLSDPYVLDGIK